MNDEISENKTSFLATKISGFNNFLFWFGKKVYSFLAAIVFIVFVGAGAYTIFVGGDDISPPSFNKDYYDELKGEKLAKIEQLKKYEKLSEEELDKLIAEEEQKKKDAQNVTSGRKDIKDKYGADIKKFRIRHKYTETLDDGLISQILGMPEDRRDDWLYGFIEYMDAGYEYFSKDNVYEVFRKENGWEKKWDINNWLWKKYEKEYVSEVESSERSKSSAEETRMFSLSVMGGSFAAFLIVVLIAIFIQIEANTRPEK